MDSPAGNGEFIDLGPEAPFLIIDDKAKDKTRSKRKKSHGIQRIENHLLIRKNYKVTYHLEQTFCDCRHERELPFDVFIIVDGMPGIIEYDGRQHFEPTNFGGKSSDAELRQKLDVQRTHDIVKNNYTREYSISLLRIAYTDDNKIEELVDKFINDMRRSRNRVEIFSDTELYKNPYGPPLESSGCQIM